jgi:hypothetical protein
MHWRWSEHRVGRQAGMLLSVEFEGGLILGVESRKQRKQREKELTKFVS